MVQWKLPAPRPPDSPALPLSLTCTQGQMSLVGTWSLWAMPAPRRRWASRPCGAGCELPGGAGCCIPRSRMPHSSLAACRVRPARQGQAAPPPPPAPPPTVIDHPDGRRPQLLRQQQVLKQAQPVGGPVAPPGQHGRQGEGGSLRGVGCGEQLGPLPGSTAEWPCSSPLHAFLHSEPSALSLQGSSSTLYPG